MQYDILAALTWLAGRRLGRLGEGLTSGIGQQPEPLKLVRVCHVMSCRVMLCCIGITRILAFCSPTRGSSTVTCLR